ncbi:hypothetical protein DFH06DRAFT_1405897 [Mycena polygramma]|nr:hypothetical protein DFH06DRAFT_1405897 [Mycena polygramma]
MSPIPDVPDAVSLAGQIFPSSVIQIATTIVGFLVALTFTVRAASPTRRAAVVAHRLRAAEQAFQDAVINERLGLVAIDNAHDFARQLRELENTAAGLCAETLAYRGSYCWWQEFRDCCSGRSFALWHCGQQLSALRNAIELYLPGVVPFAVPFACGGVFYAQGTEKNSGDMPRFFNGITSGWLEDLHPRQRILSGKWQFACSSSKVHPKGFATVAVREVNVIEGGRYLSLYELKVPKTPPSEAPYQLFLAGPPATFYGVRNIRNMTSCQHPALRRESIMMVGSYRCHNAYYWMQNTRKALCTNYKTDPFSISHKPNETLSVEATEATGFAPLNFPAPPAAAEVMAARTGLLLAPSALLQPSRQGEEKEVTSEKEVPFPASNFP